MKKIIGFTVLLIFIPFLIVTMFGMTEVEEISLKYMSNLVVRVKRVEKDRVDTIPIEEYVVGVLAGEMPIDFEMEALKAQAVASRSYVLKRLSYNKDNEYDVVDTVMNQVYLDTEELKDAWGSNYTVKINKLRTAVNETYNEYLDYNGEIIDALFFSTSNGYTEDANLVFNLDLPYLKSVDSVWDKEVSSAFSSKYTYSLQEFYEKLGLEYDKNLKIEDISKSDTNRVLSLKINGVEKMGRELYEKLGLRSTDFEISQVGSNVLFNMKGYGHGVGMSQYGALGMAKEGYKYDEILKHYYTGVEIKKI